MRASSADRQRRRNVLRLDFTKMFSPVGYNRDLRGRQQARTLTATIVQRLVDECPMSESGHELKGSQRAHHVRFASQSRHARACLNMSARCQKVTWHPEGV